MAQRKGNMQEQRKESKSLEEIKNIMGDVEDDSSDRYLIYTLGGEHYGSPLLKVREVIRKGEVKSVPYMVSHFKGVINLRGQIVGVVDLRQKFGLPIKETGHELVLIVETAEGLIGAIVDQVISVNRLSHQDIDQNPALETKVPANFMLGIAKIGERLVNVIEVADCISAEELRSLRKVRTAA